ncbi:hypothetical protein ISP15_17885 [Dyella jejuensis]|uniref:Uncharacterized protein n=2 Tax=Dyella jejuensis TaxID=1432009 RepID=A0ABW8JM56_9GAMM
MLQLASTAVGAAVGGGAGAATALDGTRYNYLSHPQLKALQDQIKQCNGDQVCIQTAQTDAEKLSAKQEQDLVRSCNASGVNCADQYKDGISTAIDYVNDPLAAQLGLQVDQYITAQDYVNNRGEWGLVKADNAVSSDGNVMVGIAGAGILAGLGAGPGILAVEGSGAIQVGSLTEIILASRGGTAAVTGAVNMGAQLIQNGGNFSQLNYINLGASMMGGYLGYGGNWGWNGLVGTGVGMMQTEANNLYYHQSNNVLVGGLANGMTTAFGFKIGDTYISSMQTPIFTSLRPAVIGNSAGASVTEYLNNLFDNLNSSQNKSNGENK